jgi:uncharacterized protein (DUF342 family)
MHEMEDFRNRKFSQAMGQKGLKVVTGDFVSQTIETPVLQKRLHAVRGDTGYDLFAEPLQSLPQTDGLGQMAGPIGH